MPKEHKYVLGDFVPWRQIGYFLDLYPFMRVQSREKKGPIYHRSKIKYGPPETTPPLPSFVLIDHSFAEHADLSRLGIDSSVATRDVLLVASEKTAHSGDPEWMTIIANSPHSDRFRVLRSISAYPPEQILALTRQGLELATAFNAIFGDAFQGRLDILGCGIAAYMGRIFGQPDRATGEILLPGGENMLRALRYETAVIVR